MSSWVALAIAGFVLTLSLLIIGLIYFTGVYSQKNTGVDIAHIDETLQRKSAQLTALRTKALKKNYRDELTANKNNYKTLLKSYRAFAQSEPRLEDTFGPPTKEALKKLEQQGRENLKDILANNNIDFSKYGK